MAAPESDTWNECPPGKLRLVAGRLRQRQRRRALGKSGAGILLAVVVFAGALSIAWSAGLYLPVIDGYRYAGVSCRQVQGLLPALAAQRLTPEIAAQVREHLRQCDHCRADWLRMSSHALHVKALPVVTVAVTPTSPSHAVGR